MSTDALPRKVRLGHSAVHVTRVSFGAAGIGNLFSEVNDAAAHLAVDAAWQEGIRCFDTAPHYGLGLSERRLGQALRARRRSEFTVSTKVGWDFGAAGVERSLAESLGRLGMDRVDIVYLDDPDGHGHDSDGHGRQALDEAYPSLEKLRAQGVVGAIGVGTNHVGLLTRFVRDTDIDVVLLAGRYTLLDQSGLEELLPTATERGVSVVAGGVLNSGLLADPKPGATYDDAEAPAELVTRAVRMQVVCQVHGVTLRSAALRFPFGHPAVASVLIGARTAAEVHDAVEQLRRPVPYEVWRGLRDAGLLSQHVPVPQEI